MNTQGVPTITMPQQPQQQQQQGVSGGFTQFNQAFHQGQQQQQILQQQYIQEQAQQQQQQQFQQTPQGFPQLPEKKDPPKLISYPNYNNTDIARPMQITAFTNTSNAMMYYSGIRRVSPKVVYESVDKALAGISQERTMNRFTSGGCFGEFRQVARKNISKGDFYFSYMNTALGSVTRENYNDLMKHLKLDDKVESNFHLAAVYCGVHFDGLFETMNTQNLRGTGDYLHYFIEGGKLLQDYHGELYHVINDYKDGDFVAGKEYTTKYPISCTNEPQIIMGQVAKVPKKCVLKFVNVPAKIMPQIPGPLPQFNEAVVLPGCKMKVNNIFTDSTGLTFIELYPVDLAWSDDHLFRKKAAAATATEGK